MNTKPLLTMGAAAALSLCVAAGIQAQNAQGKARVGETEVKGSAHTDSTARNKDRTDVTASTEAETPVGRANKASSLIGMDVRNPENEKLGEIKDLVVDLHSGKIGYAVLSVGGFLGIGEKYIAVPPSAFTVAPDQAQLVLNADKAKIQNAPSFAKNNWPDVNSPSWASESSYWLSEKTAAGTLGSVRSGTATAKMHERAHSFHGRITAVDPERRTMTVQGTSGTREFKFTEHPTITLKDNRNPRLSDLKVGYPVTVGFHEQNGSLMADSVVRSDAPEIK